MGLQITMSKIPGTRTFFTESDFVRPAFIPSRTVRFWDKTTLTAAVTGLTAGDLVKYDPTFFGKASQPLVISNSTGHAYAIHDKVLSGTAVFDFGCSHNLWDPSKVTNEYVRFAYTGTTSGWEGLLLNNLQNIRIYGGEYDTGHYGGCAWRSFAPITNCVFMGGYVSMAGGSAVGTALKTITGTTGTGQRNNIYQFEVNRYSMNPAQDPHADKGTGQHGALLHGGGFFKDNHVAIYGHDPLRPGETSAGKTWPEGGGGGVIEIGIDEHLDYSGNTFYALAENCLMETKGTNPGSTGIQYIGGWAILLYGNGILNNNVIGWVEGNHLSAGLLNCGGGVWWQTAVGEHLKVLVGRRSDVRRYPAGEIAPNNVEYPTGFRIDYIDCL